METWCKVIAVVWVTGLMAMVARASRCYASDSNPYRYFSAQTIYNDRIKPPNTVSSQSSDCTPRLFYLLIRHGSRFPSEDDYTEMVDHLPGVQVKILEAAKTGNGSLCAADLANIRDWKQRIQEEDIGALAQTGVIELEQIAKRYKKLLPSLLDREYSREKFLFQSSYMPRNILSAKAFARGLFDNDDAAINFNPKGEDPLLQAYKNCERFMEVRKRPNMEAEKLINGPISRVTIPSIEDFLGLPGGTLKYEEVFAMYKMCVFDYVIFDDSPWCAVFSHQDLQTLDYLEDLKKYYLEGPVYNVTIEQSCELIKDAVHFLRLPMEKSQGEHPVGVFRVTHSPVVNPFFYNLGLYDDHIPLRWDNKNLQSDRKWRMAVQDPYSTHVGFVVEECAGGNFELQTFVNEERFSGSNLPTGRKNLNWQTVMDAFKPIAEICDYNEVCKSKSRRENPVFSALILFGLVSCLAANIF